MGSVILLVPDTGSLYDAFAAGFSVVDPGGNWLRVSSESTDEPAAPGRLERVLQNAARQGDAHGDDARALAVLEAGPARHAGAPTAERVPLLLYRAELLVRLGERDRAVAAARELDALDLDVTARSALSDLGLS